MDGKISEQRVYCKIRAQLGFPPTEIHADLQKVYGNGALKYATICKWVCRYNEGRESVESDPRVGRLVSVLTEKIVATVKTSIEEDARYVQEIEELSGIHSSSVLKILLERLRNEQKQVIEKYDKCDPHRLEEIVLSDETWIYHFQPDSKATNKVWVSSEGDRPVFAAVAKHQIACCMRYSLIRKVQSFKFQSRKVVLSLESSTEKVFLLNLLISIRNADRALVSAAPNYSMITHQTINPLRYRNI